MAQIQGGTTYADGGQVTATNLNAHVNNAVLVPGAIGDQAAAASVTTGDSVMVLQSGALKKATLAQVQTAINPDLAPYLPRSGALPMTGELTLSSSTPSSALIAASKGYVDTGLATKVNKAGDTMTGPLTLSANATLALQAVTKQQMDAADALNTPLAAFTGANQSLTASGYQKLPGGLIIQWGTATTNNGLVTITWPIPFPNNVLSIQSSANQLGSLPYVEMVGHFNVTLTTAEFAGYYTGPISGSQQSIFPAAVNFTYLAIGF